MEEKKVLTTIEEVKAISDPFKYKILMSFYTLGKPATIKQIADNINEVPAKVHYHVKKMESLNILKLIYTKEIKGIIAKYYEPTAEMFDIRCTEDVANSQRKLMLAQSQKLIGEIYETSKNVFFDEMNLFSQGEEKTKNNVSMSDLYLTKEEAEEFLSYIGGYFKNHDAKERKTEDQDKYHCFLSFFKMHDNKSETNEADE